MSALLRLITPENTAETYDELAIDILARTIWGEAKGLSQDAMEAIACVVLNRVRISEDRGGYWWGNDVITICQKPYQFMCWNRSSPNYMKLSEVNSNNVDFNICKLIAGEAMEGILEDITNGATNYYKVNIGVPSWARDYTPTFNTDGIMFYNLHENL